MFTLWTATDSDGDGVLEYTEYFSATIETGALGTAYIPGLDDVFGCMDETADLTMILLLLLMMVPVLWL